MRFKIITLILLSICSAAESSLAKSKVTVVTSLPELAWSAKEIGGDAVDASSLLKGSENPHYVDAVPAYILRVANADIVCVAGLDLEVGYMPAVLSRSGNAKVQPGGPGYCDAGKAVSVLEKPTTPVDRSLGDIHPAGNPHFYLSPRALAEASKEIAHALAAALPEKSEAIMKGQIAFASHLQKIADETRETLSPATKPEEAPLIIEYHREFAYYTSEFGLKTFGSIEEKPGVSPSAGRIADVALAAKTAGVKMVLATDYAPASVLKRFHELSGIPVVTVPTMIRASGPFTTYAALQRHIAQSIAHHLGIKK